MSTKQERLDAINRARKADGKFGEWELDSSEVELEDAVLGPYTDEDLTQMSYGDPAEFGAEPPRFSTKDEAMEIMILKPLGEHAQTHDVDAIAKEVLGEYEDGYAMKVSDEDFWKVVEKHALDVPDDRRTATRFTPARRLDLDEKFKTKEEIAERIETIEKKEYVGAIAEGAYQDPRRAGGDIARNEWWGARYMQAEYAKDGFPKMPEDFTPSRSSGKSLSGHRRTYRRHYEGAGVSIRMPSATAIKRFAGTQKGNTFDVPIEGTGKDGTTVSGWVRCTRTDDGAWITEGLGFDKQTQQKYADAVSAVLENRRPTKALAGYDNMTQRRAEIMARMGARIEKIDNSSFITGVGGNPVAGVTFTQIDGKVYANGVAPQINAYKRTKSVGQYYNHKVKGRNSLGFAKICPRCEGAYVPMFGPHVCLAVKKTKGDGSDKAVDEQNRWFGNLFANVTGTNRRQRS